MQPPVGTPLVVEEIKPGFWRVSIPGRPTNRFLFGAIFCLCWLAGWAVGEVFALRTWFSAEEDKAGEFLILAWVLVWTVGGIAGMWLLNRLLGMAFGGETLFLSGRRLKLVRTLWGRAVPREFDLPCVETFKRNPRWGVNFQYGRKRISFGFGMTEEEREWIVEELGRILCLLKNGE